MLRGALQNLTTGVLQAYYKGEKEHLGRPSCQQNSVCRARSVPFRWGLGGEQRANRQRNAAQVGKVKWVVPKGLVLRGLNQSQEN